MGLRNKQRDKLLKELFFKKIPATVNYTAITKLAFYKKKYKTKCPVSENWGMNIIITISFKTNKKY